MCGVYVLIYISVYTYTSHPFLLSVDGYVGGFCISAIVNNAAVNTGLRVSFQISIFIRRLNFFKDSHILLCQPVFILVSSRLNMRNTSQCYNFECL